MTAALDKPSLKITLYDPSGFGGICQYTFELAEHLAGLGATVTLLAPEPYELSHLLRKFELKLVFNRSRLRAFVERILPGRTPAGEASEHAAPRASESARDSESFRAGVSRRLRALRIRWILGRIAVAAIFSRPDIFHVQWLAARHDELRLLRILKWFGIQIVYTAHDLLPHGPHSPADREFYGRLYRFADLVIVHTERNREELLESFGVERAATAVVPCGSFSLSSVEELSRDEARRELGISSERKVILFFGLIKRYKGLEYLVEAFDLLRSRIEGATLLIAGRVATEDPESGPFYEGLLRSLEGRSDVRLFPEFIPFARIGMFFTAADVVALPYVKTYQSGIIFAAYAAGKPVVVTDTGGLGETVEEGRSGFVVSPRDSTGLAEGLSRILASPETAEAMGRYAKHLSDTTYSWNGIARKTIGIYRNLIGERRQGFATTS